MLEQEYSWHRHSPIRDASHTVYMNSLRSGIIRAQQQAQLAVEANDFVWWCESTSAEVDADLAIARCHLTSNCLEGILTGAQCCRIELKLKREHRGRITWSNFDEARMLHLHNHDVIPMSPGLTQHKARAAVPSQEHSQPVVQATESRTVASTPPRPSTPWPDVHTTPTWRTDAPRGPCQREESTTAVDNDGAAVSDVPRHARAVGAAATNDDPHPLPNSPQASSDHQTHLQRGAVKNRL